MQFRRYKHFMVAKCVKEAQKRNQIIKNSSQRTIKKHISILHG